MLADDEAFEPVVGASSGWEAVSHLRQQHPGMRASLRTSADVARVLRNSNITEAAYLSSMASQVHILHDAGRCMRWHFQLFTFGIVDRNVSAGRCLGGRGSVAERAGLGFERDAAVCRLCVAGRGTPGRLLV
jgi:hypothetical protein